MNQSCLQQRCGDSQAYTNQHGWPAHGYGSSVWVAFINQGLCAHQVGFNHWGLQAQDAVSLWCDFMQIHVHTDILPRNCGGNIVDIVKDYWLVHAAF